MAVPWPTLHSLNIAWVDARSYTALSGGSVLLPPDLLGLPSPLHSEKSDLYADQGAVGLSLVNMGAVSAKISLLTLRSQKHTVSTCCDEQSTKDPMRLLVILVNLINWYSRVCLVHHCIVYVFSPLLQFS